MGGYGTELHWIEENNDYINGVLKKYNAANSVIYIGDQDTDSQIIKIYQVRRGNEDVVSRKPILDNSELFPVLNECKVADKESNKKRYEEKQKKNSNLIHKLGRKMTNMMPHIVGKEYIHSKEYHIPNK